MTRGNIQTADVSDEELAGIAATLRELERESGWSRVAAIGELIIGRFFGGDHSSWGRSIRHRSLRRLAAHPVCPLEKSALAKVVGVYVAICEDPSLQSFTNLTPSHVACVLSLERATRKRLLKEAEEQNMRVRLLAERVRQVRENVQRVSERPVSKHRRALNRMQDALSILREERLAAGEAAHFDPKAQRLMMEAIEAIADELDLFRQAIVCVYEGSLQPAIQGDLQRMGDRSRQLAARSVVGQ